MITMKTDHIHFTRKMAKEILEYYFIKGMSRPQVAMQLGVVDRQVNDIIKLYQSTLIFDWDTLIKKLKADVERRGGISKYAISQKISPHTVYNIYDKNENVDMTLKIKLLRKYQVDYTVELTEYVREQRGRKKKERPKVEKKERSKTKHYEDDLIDSGDTSEIETTSSLIQSVRWDLFMLMGEKNVGYVTQERIRDKVDTLIREATLFGIHAERLGKGRDLEKTIVKRIREGV